MKDDLTRRDFLKAAGLAVAGITGAAVLSRSAFTQEEEKKPKEDKKEDETKPPEKEENYDDLFEENESEEADPSEEETRGCPQCGALMYRQGRTWTCENCGYSYVE